MTRTGRRTPSTLATLACALLLQLGGCAALNPSPSEELLRAREQTTLSMGPGVPPMGPVVTPATRRAGVPDDPVRTRTPQR
jgi:hypothetical protein